MRTHLHEHELIMYHHFAKYEEQGCVCLQRTAVGYRNDEQLRCLRVTLCIMMERRECMDSAEVRLCHKLPQQVYGRD